MALAIPEVGDMSIPYLIAMTAMDMEHLTGVMERWTALVYQLLSC